MTSTWLMPGRRAGGTSTTASYRICLRPGCGPGGHASRGPGWPGAEPDPYDEAHLAAFEANAGVVYEQLELYRSNPLPHLGEMDLACYDRDYAPQAERDAARTAHLRRWPEAAEHAIEALDRLSKPIAGSLVNAVRGLSAGIPPTTEPAIRDAALAAHARLTGHIERAAADRPPGRRPGRPGAGRAAQQLRGDPGRPGPAGRGGRRRAGPAARPGWPRTVPGSTPAARPWMWPANWSATTRTRRG